MMSSFIDKKYINLISGQLEKFKWKSGSLANCRCPICGDSSKNKTKTRGYFYEKSNSFFYKCHNCGFGSNIKNFLDKVSPSLKGEYQLELFDEKFSGRKKQEPPKMNFKPFFTQKKGIVKTTKVSDLPDDHVCKQFVVNRNIPVDWHDKLLYTDNFNNLVNLLIDDSSNYPEEERLVIPFTDEKDEIYAVQGRKITDADTPKYYTAKTKNTERLWFNLWGVDPTETVMIVEGPIDSMFLSNAVALVGSGAITNLPDRLKDSDVIYVLDNEPRNPQIVSYYRGLIESGLKICLWPDNLREKDVNDMILSGKSKDEIETIIKENSYQSLQAELKFNNWRKV